VQCREECRARAWSHILLAWPPPIETHGLTKTDAGLRDRLCKRFGVVLDRPIRQLSKGNRQKIGVVQAFMHRPQLVILDEPTSGLDPLLQAEFR
jgi:ABC-type multidrug transport system ATPase subunit